MPKNINADEFLRRFTKALSDNCWGTLEPEWFDPDYVTVEEGEDTTEEQEWATNLQAIVGSILG